MKIQYCSDLHLEFPTNKKFLDKNPIGPVGEILLLAGDILPLSLHNKQKEFIDYVADNFEIVYWIPGNHEYYGYDLGAVADPLLEKIRSNVWLLNNQVVVYQDVNIICSTLWSRISPVNALDIQRSIADFFEILWHGRKFTTREFNQLHRKSITFLADSIKENSGAKNIVVTHHVPTLYHYPAKYRSSPLNDAFVAELYNFIDDCNAMYWIYGHHHSNTPEFSIGNTNLVTNQLGYVQRNEQSGFNGNACIVI